MCTYIILFKEVFSCIINVKHNYGPYKIYSGWYICLLYIKL